MGLTDDQLSEYEEAFLLFDSKGDDKIFYNQIGDVLRALGQNPRQSDVGKFFNEETAGTRIPFTTFLPILQEVIKVAPDRKESDFIEGFRVYDDEQNGLIHSSDVRRLLTTLGEPLKDEEVEKLLEGHENENGHVNYEEFIKAVINA